jgi:hypothetical protein
VKDSDIFFLASLIIWLDVAVPPNSCKSSNTVCWLIFLAYQPLANSDFFEFGLAVAYHTPLDLIICSILSLKQMLTHS